MKALQFDAAIPRYALGLILGRIYPPIVWSGLSCVTYRDVAVPRLPNDEWVQVKTRLGGICGSDSHLIHLEDSPSLSAFTSFPFTIGHENLGTVAEMGSQVRGFAIGDRVVAEPTLWCKPRGFGDLCSRCARGEIQLCERVTEGSISAGLEIGHCRDTGGSWSPYFVAHESQLVRIPGSVGDENAVLLEPFATCLHAVLSHRPRDDEDVLVIGGGPIGLGVIAALRAVESRAKIIALVRHKEQRDLAQALGADTVVEQDGGGRYYVALANAVNGRLRKPILGRPVLIGGASTVFECVGSSESLDDALRLADAGGRVIVAGLASIPKNVDWTPVWLKELQIFGSYVYSHDEFQGKRWRTFELALDLMARGKVDLAPLVTHRFKLKDYGRAFHATNHRGRSGAVKVVFEFDE